MLSSVVQERILFWRKGTKIELLTCVSLVHALPMRLRASNLNAHMMSILYLYINCNLLGSLELENVLSILRLF